MFVVVVLHRNFLPWDESGFPLSCSGKTGLLQSDTLDVARSRSLSCLMGTRCSEVGGMYFIVIV